MQKTKFNNGLIKTALILLATLAFSSCEGNKSSGQNDEGKRPPDQEIPDQGRDNGTQGQRINDCPVPEENARDAGIFFESKAVRDNLVIKPWGNHSHSFDELMQLGWTENDFQIAAPLSKHVDLPGKTVRFADNDIFAFLRHEKLCPKTIKFLFSYLADKEQKTFLQIIRRDRNDGEAPMSNIDKIVAHQTKRFKDLETILRKNNKYHIKFPGSSADKHALGTGIARTSWKADDHQRMLTHITSLIKQLAIKFPGRIHFGMIGDYAFDKKTGDCDRTKPNPQGAPGQKPGSATFMIHVWGANAGNFNHPDQTAGSFGSGQASCFEKQRIGVFGISTMPGGDEAILMADDKLLAKY